jgi:carboxyl-terminal processing protease
MSQYPNINAFKNSFVVTDQILNEFIQAGEKAGIKKDDAGLATSGKLLKIQLKALIARNLWDSDAYFEIINDVNTSLQRAIEAINNKTFEKLKIAEK